MIRRAVFLGVSIALAAATASAQNGPAPAQSAPVVPPLPLVEPTGPSAPPAIITLSDALERASQVDAQYQASVANAEVAAGDRTQARAGLLPAFSHTTQYLGTQGNGTTPNGRFVTNDGVHVYRSWVVMHQDLTANTFTAAPFHRADAAQALANAQLEIARRGLRVAVTSAYYGLVAAQRRYAAAQQAAQQAAQFFNISQQQERVGQAAHSDVVKAQIQQLQSQTAFQEATLAESTARLDLAVLLSPTFDENFTVVDDLDAAVALPPFAEAQMRAEQQNPALRAATEALRVAGFDVTAAHVAFLPSVAIDAVYGIEANSFALRSVNPAFPEFGPLPNLGYFVTASLNVPLWDWGALRSKLTQAEVRRRQADIALTSAQRQLVRDLYADYNEATAARAAVDGLRQAASLATDSVRLTTLRYQAGEATALEVVDAQNTLAQAQNAYADALVRYRVAIATLQTVTGSF